RGLARFGEQRLNAAIDLIDTSKWGEAYGELLAAAASYALVRDVEQAGRALLHASHALCQLELPDAADELVAWVATAEIATLHRSVGSRRLKVLAHRVTAGLANVEAASEEADRLLDVAGGQRDEEFGAALLARAQIHSCCGQPE